MLAIFPRPAQLNDRGSWLAYWLFAAGAVDQFRLTEATQNCPVNTTVIFVAGLTTTVLFDDFLERASFTSAIFILPGVTQVQNGWLKKCPHLQSVTFAGLSALASVGNSWMQGCSELTSPSFVGLDALAFVGDMWMCSCHSLVAPSFAGLGALVSIGKRWMIGCDGLTAPSFPGLLWDEPLRRFLLLRFFAGTRYTG